MISFNPGPSQLSPETKQDIIDLAGTNVLEISHRSKEFSVISEKAIEGLRTFFSVPSGYTILYATSATDAMEQTIKRLVDKNSFHFTCGAFSERFAGISRALGKEVSTDNVEWGQINDFHSANIPSYTELITVTYNETSTGATCQPEDISSLRNKYPDKLLAVDVTSIAGIIPLNISDADVWLFSVQKCFGLPAGLGIWILSPRARERALELEENLESRPGAFPLSKQIAKMEGNCQTLQTPNVFSIALLAKQLERWNSRGGVEVLHSEAFKKKQLLEGFIQDNVNINHFVPEEHARSLSTICLQAAPEIIEHLKKTALQQDITIGGGYGKLKSSTFRIANFPTHTISDLEKLIGALSH